MENQQETQSLITMAKEASIVIDDCIQVKEGEKITIGMNSARRVEAEMLASLCHERGAEVIVVDISPYVIPILSGRYKKPPQHFLDLIEASNVTILVTSQEFAQRFSHALHTYVNLTDACSAYQIDEGLGSWDYSTDDVQQVMEQSKWVMDVMEGAEWVRVTSPRGTDIKFNIEGRDCLPVWPIMDRGDGEFARPIPLWGELNWAPIENMTEGKVVIDGILFRWGAETAVNELVEWRVEDGRIVEIEGGEEAVDFRKTLEAADSNAYVVCELGIGASHKARRGQAEEKGRLGTIHIGVGNNKGIYPGGQNVSEIHGDGSVRNVTIEVDGDEIVKDGELLN